MARDTPKQRIVEVTSRQSGESTDTADHRLVYDYDIRIIDPGSKQEHTYHRQLVIHEHLVQAIAPHIQPAPQPDVVVAGDSSDAHPGEITDPVLTARLEPGPETVATRVTGTVFPADHQPPADATTAPTITEAVPPVEPTPVTEPESSIDSIEPMLPAATETVSKPAVEEAAIIESRPGQTTAAAPPMTGHDTDLNNPIHTEQEKLSRYIDIDLPETAGRWWQQWRHKLARFKPHRLQKRLVALLKRREKQPPLTPATAQPAQTPKSIGDQPTTDARHRGLKKKVALLSLSALSIVALVMLTLWGRRPGDNAGEPPQSQGLPSGPAVQHSAETVTTPAPNYHARIERDADGITISLETPPQPASEPIIIAPQSGTRQTTGHNEIIHVVVQGDTLWFIAKRYVHDAMRYPELARLSNIRNPHLIYPGDRVRIRLNQQSAP
ncbi:MAG: LysM peptidoglycan-binding domain-containing protein [Gammaproteobacteria bacterium]|nr:LysM peptidoglycan-binding domain-containing protein [Gammaproteobacteria bacterium]MDH5652456.1 LysM peptidoglycan-binding domain-containing protein [Gammaproteobacteria bacterium]